MQFAHYHIEMYILKLLMVMTIIHCSRAFWQLPLSGTARAIEGGVRIQLELWTIIQVLPVRECVCVVSCWRSSCDRQRSVMVNV